MKPMTHKEVLDEINVLYERLQSLEDCEGKYVGCGYCSFNDGRYIEALEALIDYYEVGFIEELKKIKEEMQVELNKKMESERQQMINCAMLYENQTQKYFDIIDKHIAELEGDNNAEC